MAKRDPAITARFMVDFKPKLSGSFRECTIVTAEHEPAEYKFADASGKPGYYAVPGRMKFGRITLKRGLTDDVSAWNWRKEIENGQVNSSRVNGTITMLDQDGTQMAKYDLTNVWPLKVAGPAPNANSSDLAMEEVELICESLTRSA